jgi:diaminopimelate decarboxylase
MIRQPIEAIDGVPLERLIAEHGSPLFVYSERTIRTAIRRAKAAFFERYPCVRFAWSYKTCCLRAVCDLFHQEGSFAEVASEFEYGMARRWNVPGPSIVFNGPWKPPAILERAAAERAILQIDHFEELQAVAAIARRRFEPVEVALRVHMDCGAKPYWTKFGFSFEDAFAAVRQLDGLRLTGLHTHVGTQIRDANVYRIATEKLIELAGRFRAEHGIAIDSLNLGGGFATATPFEEYADAICGTIHRLWPKGSPLPRLYLETGRALIEDAGYHLTRVVARKPGGYLVDSGTHLLQVSDLFPWTVHPAEDSRGPERDRILYGSLCMNSDVLRECVPLPEMAPGDALVIHPVGAYHLAQSMHFIHDHPRVVLIGESGTVRAVRERE